MGWFRWKRPTTPAVPLPVVSPPPEEPAPRIPFVERVQAWRQRLRAQQAQEPSREVLEAAEVERQRQRQEQIEDEIARVIAAQGHYFPGDEVAAPRVPSVSGRWGGWMIRW